MSFTPLLCCSGVPGGAGGRVMLAPRRSNTWETPEACIDLAISMAGVTATDVCYDIGCGRGGFLIRCAKTTGAKCIGIEVNSDTSAEARSRVDQEKLNDRVTVVTANALEHGYSDATVFFLYLVPRGLRLVLSILRRLKQPIRVVTYMSGFNGIIPVQVERVTPTHQPGAAWPLYLYHFVHDGGHTDSPPTLLVGENHQDNKEQEGIG